MMNDEWLIYPGVKRVAAVLARLLLICILSGALCSVAEIACATLAAGVQSRFLLAAGVLAGGAGSLFLLAGAFMLGPLAAWCHLVLPAGRGSVFTRFFTQLGAFLSLLIPVCVAYTLIMHEPLLARQEEIPLYICAIALLAVLLNLPNTKAAPWSLRILCALFPLFLLGAFLTDFEGLLPLHAASALLAAATAFHPLRLFAATAERIVSLPEKEDI